MPYTVGQYLTVNDLKSQELGHTLGYGVLNGLKVVPEAPASMDIEVETGKAYVADTLVEKGAVTTLTVTAADPTNPRKDIVVCNSVGTLSIVAGTPEAALPDGNVGIYTLNPEPPSIPATSIILAEIWVPAAATEITGSEIYDKRVSIADFLAHASRHQNGGADEISVADLSGLLSALATNQTWSGLTASLVAGEDLTIGQCCYMKDDGKMYKAVASAASTAIPGVALATATIDTNATGIFLLIGFFREDTVFDFAAGDILYVNDVTAGALDNVIPAGNTEMVQRVGICFPSAHIVYFKPDLTVCEVSV